LLEDLKVKVGDRIKIGEATFKFARFSTKSPAE
jgi:predicted lysophospholipase L1 biosynthesis ABC-type transport system permease subunit